MLVPAISPTPIDVEVTEQEILADLLFPAPVPQPADEVAQEEPR